MATTPFHWPQGIKPPVAEKKPVDVGRHGDVRMDEYYWMNDYFRKGPDSAKVLGHLKAENDYLEAMMAATKRTQELLFEEMKFRIKEKDASVPVYYNGYYYYTRFEEGKQYFMYCRKKEILTAPEELLLDVNVMAEGHSYYAVTGFNISPNNNLLAFGVDTLSRRQYAIYIKDLSTGDILPASIPATTGKSSWSNDNQFLFYTRTNPETLLTEKICRHKLGTAESQDVVVYTEPDTSNYISIHKTRSDSYFVISSSGTLSSELRILDADSPLEAFQLFAAREKDVLYSVDHWKDRFFVLTNKAAINFRLMETPQDKTAAAHWIEVIPHRKDVLLEGVDVFRDFMVVTERREGLLRLRVSTFSDGAEHYVDFGEPAYTAYVGVNPQYDTASLRYQYTSLTTPQSTFEYAIQERKKTLLKQQEVVGGYDPGAYVTQRIYAPSRDGVSIPLSVVYKKTTGMQFPAPLLLYGYGSYGISMDAVFSSNRLSLLDRGFVYVIAHVRGGQELGRKWYEDGKLFAKQNTFNDFIDAAEYLIGEGFTEKSHLYAMGGSAGGLLMGVVATQRPDLWNGVIASVPFVDVVTTMLDESIPLTTNEYDEWGNPRDLSAYANMKGYSPYDNAGAIDFPSLLVLTGLHDSQVQYFEPVKWVARIRDRKSGSRPVLLHTNLDTGHGGASGRFDYLKEIALEYAFLLALESKLVD